MTFSSMINQLIDVASKSNMKIKLAAGVFYSKKGFVAIGYNTTRTYSNKEMKPSEHAECAVLRQLRKFPNINARDLKLLVVRLGANDKLLHSMPCVDCTNTIKSHGIRKVYYIDENNTIVCQRTDDLCTFHEKCPYRHVTTTNIWFHEVSNTHCAITKTVQFMRKQEKQTPFFTIKMGEKIAMLRRVRQLSQKELAHRLSLPIKSIIMMENGKQQYTAPIYSKLVRCFGHFSW